MINVRTATKFDQAPATDATLADLDLKEVEDHVAHALRVNRYSGDASTVERFLVDEHAAIQQGQTLVPTVAGLLMFGRRPQRLLPHATVSIAHYRGTMINSGDVLHLHEYSGTVRTQIDRVVAYLAESMRHGYTLTSGAQRQERPQYPALALRELTVNAIAHRDYTMDASTVRVTMLRNQIEWVSPGSLPPGVTVETILEHQFARNSTLLRLLFQRSYVEKIGQGLDTVFAECRRMDLPLPTMHDTSLSFVVSMTGHDLEGTPPWRADLTDTQFQIVEVLQQRRRAMSAPEIADALARQQGTTARGLRSVQLDLKVLVELGLIARVGQARATAYVMRAL
jgi:ATP-dependent DNA helicase RecG